MIIYIFFTLIKKKQNPKQRKVIHKKPRQLSVLPGFILPSRKSQNQHQGNLRPCTRHWPQTRALLVKKTRSFIDHRLRAPPQGAHYQVSK